MTKKNIRPQQVAPVERETISTAKDQSGQVTAQSFNPLDFGRDYADYLHAFQLDEQHGNLFNDVGGGDGNHQNVG